MTAALDLLDRALAAGISVEAVDGRLKVRAPSKPADDILASLRAHRAEIVTTLADDHAERAAIIEDGSGCRADWADGYARLDLTGPPATMPPERWRRLIDDGGFFIDEWSSRAAALGWSPLDVFGCDRVRPFDCMARIGLAWLINGRRVIAITTDTAILESSDGSRLSYRCTASDGRTVCAWDLQRRTPKAPGAINKRPSATFPTSVHPHTEIFGSFDFPDANKPAKQANDMEANRKTKRRE